MSFFSLFVKLFASAIFAGSILAVPFVLSSSVSSTADKTKQLGGESNTSTTTRTS